MQPTRERNEEQQKEQWIIEVLNNFRLLNSNWYQNISKSDSLQLLIIQCEVFRCQLIFWKKKLNWMVRFYARGTPKLWRFRHKTAVKNCHYVFQIKKFLDFREFLPKTGLKSRSTILDKFLSRKSLSKNWQNSINFLIVVMQWWIHITRVEKIFLTSL